MIDYITLMIAYDYLMMCMNNNMIQVLLVEENGIKIEE